MRRRVALIGLGWVLALAVANPVRAQDAVDLCRDVLSREGQLLMDKLMKASAACEKGKAAGKISPNVNCRTSFISEAPPAEHDPTFVARVIAAREHFTEKLRPACVDVVVATGVGTPCGQFDRVTLVDDLIACIIYDGHGRLAWRVQNVVFASQAGSDPARDRCVDQVGKVATTWMKRRLVNTRICGKAAAKGDACDVAALAAKLALVVAKLERKVLSRCAAISPTGVFGGNCARTFTTWEEAYACVINATANETNAAARMVYPGMGF